MKPIPTDTGNYYGSTIRAETEDGSSSIPKQTFAIVEPSFNEQRENGSRNGTGVKSSKPSSCCRTAGKSGEAVDGLRIIIISMFVFSVGVTVALVIQIASESSQAEIQETNRVVSGHSSCSGIGENVMRLGGNAVDAAVATTVCMALMEPHITGLGGGGMMLIHQHRSNKSVVIDFRETAPASATIEKFSKNPDSAKTGFSSIGVPGFLAGLEYAHEKYGSGHMGINCCEWKDLLWNSITLALKGQRVSQHFLNATATKINKNILELGEFQGIRDFLRPSGNPVTEHSIYSDIPIYNNLIETLKIIARNGSDVFYRGIVGQKMIESLKGSLTMEDLQAYQVEEREPIFTKVGDFEVMSTPSPSSGPELLALLNTMEAYNQTHGMLGIDEDYLATLAKVLRRLNKWQLGLGDPAFGSNVANQTEWLLNKDNTARWLSVKGQSASLESASYNLAEAVSSHVSVMDRKDNYVAVVTSLNTWFGSKVMSENGIIMNNALANFEILSESISDQSSNSANKLSPGKRPLSKNVVALASDTKNICGRRILLGGATPDAVGQVLYDPLFLKGDLVSSTGNGRLLIQNDTLYIEDAYKGFPQEVLTKLTKNEVQFQLLMLPYTSVNSLEKFLDVIVQVQDFRSEGEENVSEEYEKHN